jgi:hypothetical protein
MELFTIVIISLIGEMEVTWGDSEAIKDESKIPSSRTQGGRD